MFSISSIIPKLFSNIFDQFNIRKLLVFIFLKKSYRINLSIVLSVYITIKYINSINFVFN